LSSRVGTDPGLLSRRWNIELALAVDLIALDGEVARGISAAGLRWPGLSVISGHRSRTLQDQLNPSAPNSKHVRSPSLAVDLRVGDQPASVTEPTLWARIGRIWQAMGHRWGGVFRPPDLNHFDIDELAAQRQPSGALGMAAGVPCGCVSV